METKKCSRCKLDITVSEFGNNSTTPDGLKYVCKACDREIHRRLYQKTPQIYRERSKTNRQRAKENHLCIYCYKPLDGAAKDRCRVCTQKNCEAAKRSRDRLKDAVYGAYGGYRCACCGETEKVFLQIDHIKGGGNKHRLAQFGSVTPGSDPLYRLLSRTGFPAGYQVLCANCNVGKVRTGICPHELKRKLKQENNDGQSNDEL